MLTLRESIDLARYHGFACNFLAEQGGLRCVETGERFTPDQAIIVAHRRFEGQSSEDDKEVLYFLVTSSGARGLLVDAYGTYASEKVAEFLRGVRVCEN